MTFSIYDIQRYKESNFEKGIVETFIRESDILKYMPIEDIDTLQITSRRTNSLPTVDFRSRGERFSDGGTVGFNTVTDAVYDIGSEITLDRADMLDKGPYIVNPLQYNIEARIKSIVYKMNDYLINGDQATDPKGFDGIKTRISLLNSAQTIYGTSDGTSSGTHTDVRAAATLTNAICNSFLSYIDDAIYAVDGHKADCAFTDADFIRAIKRCLRFLGIAVNEPGTPDTLIGQRDTTNQVNSGPQLVWNGVKWFDMGVKVDQTTKIVATETVDSQACRPVYFSRLGGDFLSMIQMGSLDTTEPFPLDDGVSWRVVIAWFVGLHHVHPRFGSKLTGIRVA